MGEMKKRNSGGTREVESKRRWVSVLPAPPSLLLQCTDHLTGSSRTTPARRKAAPATMDL